MRVAKKKEQHEENHSDHAVNSVLRALSILEFVGRSNSEASVTDASIELGLHKSTVSRLMATLASKGFLRQNAVNGKYCLGLKLAALGTACLAQIDLRQQARPYLERVMEASQEAVHLGVLEDGMVVYVDKVDSSQMLTMKSRIGARVPVHCTALGKAICAHLPEAEVLEIIKSRGMSRHTVNTLVEPDEYINSLRMVRTLGYAVDDEEHEEGVRCMAVPVMDHTGNVAAAISLSAPTIRMSRERMREMAPLLIKAGQDLSREMGCIRD